MKRPMHEITALVITLVLGVLVTLGVILANRDAGLESSTQARDASAPPVAPLRAQKLGAQARSEVTLTDLRAARVLVEQGRDGIWACAECHGLDGAGKGLAPRLAGLPSGYLAKQLQDYRAGLRLHASMQRLAETLSPDEVIALARYFATLETSASAAPRLGGDLERGRVLAYEGDWSVGVPACFSCHGSLGWGVEDLFPPLAGQHPVYTLRQLGAWIGGTRINSPVRLMEEVALGLSRRDRHAIADFLATLPPPRAEATPEVTDASDL